MRSYRCFFLNSKSAFVGVQIIEAETDDEAVQRAEVVFREKGAPFSGFEVWDCAHRVGRQLKATE